MPGPPPFPPDAAQSGEGRDDFPPCGADSGGFPDAGASPDPDAGFSVIADGAEGPAAGGVMAGPPAPPEVPAAPSLARRLWSRLGGEAFLVSAGIHATLLIVALTWVVSVAVVDDRRTESFATGAGGGAGGERAGTFEHRVRMAKPRDLMKSPARLAARSPGAGVALPDIQLPGAGLLGGARQDGLSKGLGGGSGVGVGRGDGIGVGGGRNLVSKLVLGMRMEAENVAVYLDNSGSMRPYLETVKAAIFEQYPDADIFEHDGIAIRTQGGRVLGGENVIRQPTVSRGKTPASRLRGTRIPESMRPRAPAASGGRGKTKAAVPLLPPANPLTPQGMRIHARHSHAFDAHSVGAWTDVMMCEDYDALVIVSDFQDGVAVRRTGRRGRTVRMDDDTTAAWCQRWREHFAKARASQRKAPKLYLISIQRPPQKIWQECVEASGGGIRMMPVARKRPAIVETARKEPGAAGGAGGKTTRPGGDSPDAREGVPPAEMESGSAAAKEE
ncbi:MAG: hypothetical protein LBG65_06305 [Puniceicoccales bacterium]|nr:hypothetical protein [Puniceicoccales bacterium]